MITGARSSRGSASTAARRTGAPLLRSVPATPTRCARASSCCRGCSACAPARTRCSRTARGPACCTRSSAAPRRASGGSSAPLLRCRRAERDAVPRGARGRRDDSARRTHARRPRTRATTKEAAVYRDQIRALSRCRRASTWRPTAASTPTWSPARSTGHRLRQPGDDPRRPPRRRPQLLPAERRRRGRGRGDRRRSWSSITSSSRRRRSSSTSEDVDAVELAARSASTLAVRSRS